MSKKITLFVKFISMNLLLLLLTVLLFQTCSDDNSPTEPETQSSLAEATVGSGGGTLKTDDFELSVPVGAFPVDTKLTLNLVENEDSGFDNIVSREFKLKGLPQSFSQPLTIKIKYSGKLTDSSYIAIGENVWVSSLNKEKISYHFLLADDSSCIISAKIAPPEDNNSSLGKSTPDEIIMDGVSIYVVTNLKEYLSANKHFKITYNTFLDKSKVKDLAAYLETAYTKIQDLGFSYSRRTNWPVEVTVKKLGSTVYGYSTNSMWGDNYGYMEFNMDKMNEAEEMKVTAGHEFFHMVQSLYDPRNRYSKSKFQSENLWIHEACSVWSESIFSNNPNYVSDAFLTSAGMVIHGAHDSDGENANFFGYGMASFIKYITDEFGVDILVKIYDEIYKGNNSFSAIDNVISEPTLAIWDDFLKKYLTYNIYRGNGFEPRWLFKEAASNNKKFIIQSDIDTLKKFSNNYHDLATQIFYINVKNDNLNLINENSQLVFEVSGKIIGDIQIFKENSEESLFLEEGTESVTINNFKSISDAGYVIIAAVSNLRLVYPYSETNSGEVTIKVVNKEADPTPVITEIVDRKSIYNNTIHNFTLPLGDAEIRGRNFREDCKVFINGIESTLQYRMFNDTTGFFQMPEQPGNISVKVVSDAGESNEFSYYCGVPLDYLATAESVEIIWRFTVGDLYAERILFSNPSDEVIVFPKSDFTWKDNVLTVDLSKVPNVNGSVQYTFAATGHKVENLKLDYTRSNESPNEIVHYLGEDFLVSQPNSGIKLGFRYSNEWTSNFLNSHTISMTGTTDYYGDGNIEEFDSLRTYYPQLKSMYLNFNQ
ncbi:hypothetical protein MNBD_IGNAVI01-229 [hydrothermal vent metagenome]|uniref:Uncharacterized protein n=2 Tax=hydrothermal vent metagenome TaxID=652676 RepID=A0A3B1CQS1_9ZZZZ